MSDAAITGYRNANAKLADSHTFLLPAVLRLMDGLDLPAAKRRLFELGCGNGSVARELTARGWDPPRWRGSHRPARLIRR